MGLGDRRQERRIRDQFRDAETRPRRANAAEPRAFRVLIRDQLERQDWLADDAVRCEPVSALNSLLTGK